MVTYYPDFSKWPIYFPGQLNKRIITITNLMTKLWSEWRLLIVYKCSFKRQWEKSLLEGEIEKKNTDLSLSHWQKERGRSVLVIFLIRCNVYWLFRMTRGWASRGTRRKFHPLGRGGCEKSRESSLASVFSTGKSHWISLPLGSSNQS